MRVRIHILIVIAACVFGVIIKARAQSPPLQQCTGGRSLFAVTGDSASVFRYTVTGGVFIDTANHDSIVVQWGMEEGLYRIGVQEISLSGCAGEWIYMNVDLKGIPFRFKEKEVPICPGESGESLNFDIDMNLYKNVRWSDPNIPAQGITSPGEYQIWVEDMHGCKFTDTVSVVICNLSPVGKTLSPVNKVDKTK